MGDSWLSLIVDETSMASDRIFTVGRILKDVGKISFVILVSKGFARETNAPGVLPKTFWKLAAALGKVSEVVGKLSETALAEDVVEIAYVVFEVCIMEENVEFVGLLTGPVIKCTN